MRLNDDSLKFQPIDDHTVMRQPDGLQVDYCRSLGRTLAAMSARFRSRIASLPTDEQMQFPGMLVQRTGRVLIAAGCSEEADDTVSVTVPVIMASASWKDHASLIALLFSGVHQFAASRGVRGIHCLVSKPDGEQVSDNAYSAAELMRHSGLQCAAEIVRLQKTTPSELLANSPTGCRNHLRTFRFAADQELPSPDHKRLLNELLEQVLENSLDLPPAMRPTCSQLLATWKQRNATIIIAQEMIALESAEDAAGHGAEPRNLGASDHLSTADSSRTDKTEMGDPHSAVSPSPLNIAAVAVMTGMDPDGRCPSREAGLEYVAVSPRCRRRGIARQLLFEIEQKVAWTAASASDAATITAFADNQNLPALQLYSVLGYQITQSFDLYFSKLTPS